MNTYCYTLVVCVLICVALPGAYAKIGVLSPDNAKVMGYIEDRTLINRKTGEVAFNYPPFVDGKEMTREMFIKGWEDMKMGVETKCYEEIDNKPGDEYITVLVYCIASIRPYTPLTFIKI